MKILLKFAVIAALCPSAWAACPASYSFPGSGVPLNASNWTQVTPGTGGATALNENSGVTFPVTASTQGAAIWVGSSCSPGNDHFSQAVLTASGGGLATGVMVRATTAGNGYLYAPGLSGIFLLTGLGGSALTSCPAVAVGHTMMLAAVGTTLTAYDNGSPICQVTDSTYATGNAGIVVDRRTSTTDSLGSFQVGASPPVPLLNPSAALSTAVFQNSDGGKLTYPSIGASPTYQQATKLRFIPSNIAAVYSSAATPVPICYTTDGSTPTATTPGTCSHGTTYTFNAGPSGLINFDGSTTIKMLSTAAGFVNSGVVTISLTITPFYPYPVITGQTNGTYSYSPLIATLNGTFGSNIIYTTNGTTPTANGSCVATNGTAASNGVQVTLPNTATTTVKFITCVGGVSSAVQSGTYTQRAAVTWYVDTTAHGGGTRFSSLMTSGQCNGQSQTAYVSGTNQPCPFNDVRYLWDDDSGLIGQGQWVIAGGDTVIIKGCTALGTQSNPSNPNCRIGWDINSGGGASNNWCNSVGNAACTNPWLPAGSATQRTQILGQNFASCATGGNTNPRNYTAGQLTQIFGGFGLTNILNLSDTQHVQISCLEITSHNGACTTFGTPAFPASCNRNPPLSDYAGNGIATTNQTSDLVMTDIYIHGLDHAGVQGPFGAGIQPTRVFIGFNGFAAWNMDDGVTTPDGVGATMLASYVYMIGNGCPEEYPIVHTVFSAMACYATINNGFGDAWSGQDTILDTFSCDHCDMEYNTKDATIGPHPLANTIIISNSKAVGNGGSAWKFIVNINGTLDFHDNLSVFNCNRMSAALPGAAQNFNQNTGLPGSYLSPAGDFCRAGGNGWAANLQAGATWNIYNNTFISNSDNGYQAFLDCGSAYNHPSGTCGTATLTFTNNVFLGYTMNGQPNGPAMVGVNDVTITPIFHNNISLGEKSGTGLPCGSNGNLCTSPLLVSQPAQTPNPTTETFLDAFNFNLTSGSPVRSTGTTPCPTVDFAGNAQTSPCTMGALVFATAPPPTNTGVTLNGVKLSGTKLQ